MKQIFVVEGKNDVSRLKQVFPNINVVSVGGSSISLDVVTYLKSLEDTHEIILCLDPDFPGLKIRDELEQSFKKVSHIFLDRSKSFSKNRKKIGLEHLSNEEIITVFNNIYRKSETTGTLTLANMYEFGLVGEDHSKELRAYLSDRLNLGHANAKTMLKRLNERNISFKEIEKTLKEINV